MPMPSIGDAGQYGTVNPFQQLPAGQSEIFYYHDGIPATCEGTLSFHSVC